MSGPHLHAMCRTVDRQQASPSGGTRASLGTAYDRSCLFRKSRILHFGEQNSACTLPTNCVSHSRHCRNGAFGRAARLTRCWHPAEQKWLIHLFELCMVNPHALHVRDVVALTASLSVRHAGQTGTVLVVGLPGAGNIKASSTQLRIGCNVLVVTHASEQVDRARWVSVSEVP